MAVDERLRQAELTDDLCLCVVFLFSYLLFLPHFGGPFRASLSPDEIILFSILPRQLFGAFGGKVSAENLKRAKK